MEQQEANEQIWQIDCPTEPDRYDEVLEEDKQSMMEDCLYWKQQAVECTKVLMSGNYLLMDVYSCRDTVRTFDRCVHKMKQKYDVTIEIDENDFPNASNDAESPADEPDTDQ